MDQQIKKLSASIVNDPRYEAFKLHLVEQTRTNHYGSDSEHLGAFKGLLRSFQYIEDLGKEVTEPDRLKQPRARRSDYQQTQDPDLAE